MHVTYSFETSDRLFRFWRMNGQYATAERVVDTNTEYRSLDLCGNVDCDNYVNLGAK